MTHETGGGSMTEVGDSNAEGIPIRTEIEFAKPAGARGDAGTAVEIRNANLFYAAKQALFDITMNIGERQVTAFIGRPGAASRRCSGA